MGQANRTGIFFLEFLVFVLVIFAPKNANEKVFLEIKSEIIKEIVSLIDEGFYSKATDLAGKYRSFEDPDILRLAGEAEEKELYRYTKIIPSRNILMNRRLYAILREKNPQKRKYELKYNHYDSLFNSESREKKSLVLTRISEKSSQIKARKTEQIRDLIRNKKIHIGMTEKDVLLSWGKPSEVRQIADPGGRYKEWAYPTRRFVYFADGICIAFTQGVRP